MIIPVGGEFLDAEWTTDGLFVARDMDGSERVRITFAGWPATMLRHQRLQIAWDLCATVLYPEVRRVVGQRRFTDPPPVVEP